MSLIVHELVHRPHSNLKGKTPMQYIQNILLKDPA